MWDCYRYVIKHGTEAIELLVYAQSEQARKRTAIVHAAHLQAVRR